MRIALIADAYPPLRTSCAVQIRDLSRELARQGHEPTAIVPSADMEGPWEIEHLDGVQVLRLGAPRTKDIGYVWRTVGETLLPFAMLRHLRRSPLRSTRWDGVVWYSPTIFLGPLARALKRSSDCRGYLILRDIFPEWAVDMGLLRRGPAYRLFKLVEHYQYSVADAIGVQTPANLAYMRDWSTRPGRRLEVLQNWLADAPDVGTRVCVAQGRLSGRTIFAYAGNMGVAQGVGALLDLAERMRARRDIGFVFVGRGSDAARLRAAALERALDNVEFHDEIEPDEIPGLLAQCHVGLVALDPRHKTHNIPGKFLTYMQAGLPVLARINPGNDLGELINREGVGRACIGDSLDQLQKMAEDLAGAEGLRKEMSSRARALAKTLFSAPAAARQILAALA